jgi:hypothetical protein
MGYEKQSDRIIALEKQVEELGKAEVVGDRVTGLEKSLSEAQGAVRRLAQQQESNIKLISQLTEDVSVLRAELQKAQNVLSKANLYENSITRYD